MNHRDPRRDDAAMRPTSRWHATLLATSLVAACGGTPGAATPPAAPASAAAPQTATPAPAASVGGVGGLSISSILGASQTPPPSTSWIRISDPAAPFGYEVPSTWTGHAAYPWVENGQAIGTVLAAGPDPSKLATDFSVPGIALGVSANPAGMTARQVVEADTAYAGTCTPGEIEDAVESGARASFRLWERCAGGDGFLVVLAIVPADGKGLIAIIFQGTAQADLGYLDRITNSVEAAVVAATPGPAATFGGPVSGQAYTISMDFCTNQHGQGVAEGLIRNDDTLVHSYRIVVAFSDPNDVLLNDTWGRTPDVPPGTTARWQAVLPSGLPSVSVTCRITRVELVN